MLKKVVIMGVLSSSLAFGMGSADININDETLQVGAEFNLNNSYNLNNNSNYFFTASYLRSEDDTTTNEVQTLSSVGLKIVNPYVDSYGFSLGLGIKGVIADSGVKTCVAAPLGIFASYMVNEQIHIDAELGYAPKVLAFGDGDGYKEWNAKLNYKIIDNGFAYVGGRGISATYSNAPEFTYDKTMFFGFKVQF
jgi:hypothetical protein